MASLSQTRRRSVLPSEQQNIVATIARMGMDSLDAAAVAESEAIDPQAEATRLFAEHGAPLFRFCRSVLRERNDAEDAVQETFLKLLQHLRSGGDRRNLKSWLFTVAVNACRDRLRWRVRWRPWRAELDRRTVAPDQPSPELRHARKAFLALSARDRMLLSLRASGLSYREIGVAAGIREQSVGRLLARAVDRWKRHIP